MLAPRREARLFLYAESLIELAIRVGIADLVKCPESVTGLLGVDPQLNLGLDLTPPGLPPGTVREPTLADDFQQRVTALARLKGEEGLAPIFRSAMPGIPDLVAYLKVANFRFAHGYPNEAQDLPGIYIALGGEHEAQQYAGQLKVVPAQQVPGRERWLIGSDFEGDYQIHCLSPNYDETVFMFILVKYGLLKYRAHLEAYGMRQATMAWQPCEPAPEYLQGGVRIYQRTCILSITKDDSLSVYKDGYSELAYNVQAGGETLLSHPVIPPVPGDQA